MRNDELHSALSPFTGVDQDEFWQRYWAQVILLVHAQDKTLEALVGEQRVAAIEKHVAQNKANIAARVKAQVERAKQRYEAAATSRDVAAEIAEINQRDQLDREHRSSVECPACSKNAWLLGNSADQEDIEYDYEDGTARELLSVWADGFGCEACGLHFDAAEYVKAAGLPGTFEDDRPTTPATTTMATTDLPAPGLPGAVVRPRVDRAWPPKPRRDRVTEADSGRRRWTQSGTPVGEELDV